MVENTDFNPPADPWKIFREWYALAEKQEPSDPNAMSLATVGKNGVPSVRIVLMKSFDPRGIVFFTNHHSRKGEQLLAHPKAAICLHWKSLKRQIRAEGLITQVTKEESDEYFATRPRGSQIGAWASKQSQHLDTREELEQRVNQYEKQYEGKTVPRPDYWGGFCLKPLWMEFWQERLYRLHDRVTYRRPEDNAKDVWADDRIVYHSDGNDEWEQERLYP